MPLADFRVVGASVGDALAVGRKRDVRVHVAGDNFRSSAQNWSAIVVEGIFDATGGATKVEVTAVG